MSLTPKSLSQILLCAQPGYFHAQIARASWRQHRPCGSLLSQACRGIGSMEESERICAPTMTISTMRWTYHWCVPLSHSPASPTQSLIPSFVALYRNCSSFFAFPVHLHEPLILAPFNRASARCRFQSWCHWIFADSGDASLFVFFLIDHSPSVPHPLPSVSDPTSMPYPPLFSFCYFSS